MSIHFEKHAAKGNEFLNRLALQLGHPGEKEKAGRILRSTLRALRNHLTVEESFQLIAQLPMVLKAMYVDGWVPAKHKRIKLMDEFLLEVLQEERWAAFNDLKDEYAARMAVEAVIVTMAHYVSFGELNDVIAVLPQELKEFFKHSLEA